MTQEWQSCNTGQYPDGMVHAGVDNGMAVYVGRAHFKNDLLPAKVIPQTKSTFVCYAGAEHLVTKFDVLKANVKYVWRPGANGSLPVGAAKLGHTSDGEALYMGRALHDGQLTLGKVHCSHKCLYIPWKGKEVKIGQYEVLCTE